MSIVTERLDAYPIGNEVIELKRNEELLFTKPKPGPVKLLSHENIQAVHFDTEYVPRKFSPPKGVYESDFLRVEWQQMKGRQPFYHRNADVDELSYQVSGERTLMTEYGTLELRSGDFSRIPVGVGHDNYGREEIHLLFYVPAPVEECVPTKEGGEVRIPPFEGWQANPFMPEVMTECLGGPECDIAASLVDETLLLEHASQVDKSSRLRLIRPEGVEGQTEWLYKSKHVWIGNTLRTKAGYHGTYTRHRRAEEIQYQIKGTRTIISQRGILKLEPGDFVSIPNGVAFTDVPEGLSEHISILTHNPSPAKAPIVRVAESATYDAVKSLHKQTNGH